VATGQGLDVEAESLASHPPLEFDREQPILAAGQHGGWDIRPGG
jgi:hypothetical protein